MQIFANRKDLAKFSVDEFISFLCDKHEVIKNNPKRQEDVVGLERAIRLIVDLVNAGNITGKEQFYDALEAIYEKARNVSNEDYQGKIMSSFGVFLVGDNLMVLFDLINEIKGQFWKFQALANFLKSAWKHLLAKLTNPQCHLVADRQEIKKLPHIIALIRKGNINNAIEIGYGVEDTFIQRMALEVLVGASLVDDGLNIDRAWEIVKRASDYPEDTGGLYLHLLNHLGSLEQFEKAGEIVSQIRDTAVQARMSTFLAVHTGDMGDIKQAWESILACQERIAINCFLDLIDTCKNVGLQLLAREYIKEIRCEPTKMKVLKRLNQ